MKYCLLVLLLATGCQSCTVKADAIKACGEACKDFGGIKHIGPSSCMCYGR